MKTFLQLLCVCTFLFINISKSFSQAGTLDSSFGGNGKVTTDFGNLESEYAQPIAIQSDGKIIVASSIEMPQSQGYFAVIRYNANGTFDSSFGVNGTVQTYFDTGEYIRSIASAVMIQPDGKIIVGGYELHPMIGPDYFVLARYLPNGDLDSSFGKNGKSAEFTDHEKKALYCLALQQDGKILAGGFSNGYYVVRYKSNGIIDSSFAVNGILRGENTLSHGVTALSIQSDGKILTGGSGGNILQNASLYFRIDRVLQSGMFDSSFGNNGHVFTDFFNGNNSLYSLLTLSNGSIIATGSAINEMEYGGFIALAKYKSTGELDSSFGTNGKTTTKLDEEFAGANKVLAQADGKLIITGQGASENVIVGRFTSNGNVDSTFGTYGKATTSFGTGTYSYSGALQNDGKIITISQPYISLARFNNDAITISIKKNISTLEGNSSTTPAAFKIVLNKPSTQTIKVNYATQDGTAKAGTDYVAATGTITFKPGQVSKNVVVNIIGDNIPERNEKFYLQLSDPQNAVLGTLSTASCTIKNDDAGFADANNVENISVQNKNISIYPNPVKDVLKIDGLNAKEQNTISIIDVQGKIVLKTTTQNSSLSLNVKQLAAGSYFVKIEANNHTTTVKFVKE